MAVSYGASAGADRGTYRRKKRVCSQAKERKSCCVSFPVRVGAYSARQDKKLKRLLFALGCDKQEGMEQGREVLYRVKLSSSRTFLDVTKLLRGNGYGPENGPYYSERTNDLRGAVIGVASGSGELPERCQRKNVVRRAVKARLDSYPIRGLLDVLFGEDSGDRGYRHVPIVVHGEVPDSWDMGAEEWLSLCAEYPIYPQVFRAIEQLWVAGADGADDKKTILDYWTVEILNLWQFSPNMGREKRVKAPALGTGANREPYGNPTIGLVWEHPATGGHYQYGAGI